jgi:hypothetical protein
MRYPYRFAVANAPSVALAVARKAESTMRYLKPLRSQQVRDKVNEIFA